jgi:hypothetical protein
MTRNKLNRIAFVQFSENGKIYPTQCERNDIGEGDQVEVLMRANSDDAYYLEGSIVGITQERWNCRSRVENLISEVKYVPSKEGFLDRKVDLSARKTPDFSNWKSQKSDYFITQYQTTTAKNFI